MTLDYSESIDDVVMLNEKEIKRYDDGGDFVWFSMSKKGILERKTQETISRKKERKKKKETQELVGKTGRNQLYPIIIIFLLFFL